MKRALHFVLLFIVCPFVINAQITTPVIRANFGVDADLRSNYFNGLVQSGNDDWFIYPGSVGTGQFVIDTTGAAAIVAGYLSDVAPWPKRKASLFRTMSRPGFSIVNNRLWLDAIWVRDYHGTDTTVFTSGSDKNGMSPVNWTGGTQSVPDKNDILDMFVHVRRAGPATTDPLWLFGGLSLDNTTGNRYFDFEMYQTDINYDRPSGNWFGYGPDAGHTSWEFDAAGNITKPGDIIFSAEYQNSALTNIEARVWVQKAVWQSTTPVAFNWSGQFDGASAGATYGYASILPKTVGAFYTGLGSGTNTWAGPFQLILQDNTLTATYAKDQFMEFSVDLTKLGLDPVTLLGGDICGSPFNRIVVKTRSSSSFTSELKDFVAPTDLFLAPRVDMRTQAPYICDDGSISRIYVNNYVSTSTYLWSTPDGNILTSPASGPYVDVDKPGTYIVNQYLQAGCSIYASDTIQILPFAFCNVLSRNLYDFTGAYNNGSANLNWKVLYNSIVSHFEIERSADGINYTTIGRVDAQTMPGEEAAYSYTDPVGELAGKTLFYRVKLQEIGSKNYYSSVVWMSKKTDGGNDVNIMPNPVRDIMQLQIQSEKNSNVQVNIYDPMGKMIKTVRTQVQKGYNVISLSDLADQPRGMYHAVIFIGDEQFSRKIMVVR